METPLLVTALVAALLGLLVCFAGYRLFLALLPIWGFLTGFGLGAIVTANLTGDPMLSTPIAWIAAVAAGVILGLLAHFFFLLGVALYVGSLGFGLGVSLMLGLGFESGLGVWLVGVGAGILLAVITLALRLQRYLIIFVTALSGAGAILTGAQLLLGRLEPADLARGALLSGLRESPLWLIAFVVVAALGMLVQLRSSRDYDVRRRGR
ncbi:MAG: DUF4203 domain-containing protein [Candidatus Promineifilaceae bacterium]